MTDERSLDSLHDFEDEDGNEYNFFQFEIGETVQYRDENTGNWYEGTLCRIDELDPELPWGVAEKVIEDVDLADWTWLPPSRVRAAFAKDYTIEEEEDMPMAVSW